MSDRDFEFRLHGSVTERDIRDALKSYEANRNAGMTAQDAERHMREQIFAEHDRGNRDRMDHLREEPAHRER